MPHTLRLTRTLTLKMPVADFFEVATNTDRVNRVVGLPAARFTMAQEPGGRQALRADARLFGVPVHWYELPFEWVENRSWTVHRIFEGIPLRWLDFRTTLKPLAAKRTRVEIVAEVLPTNLFGRLAAVAVFQIYALGRLVRLYRTLERRYRQQAPAIFPPPAKPAVNTRALEVRGRDLRAHLPLLALTDRLLDHLATAPDDQVRNMRPFLLARRWGTDRMETLRLFLYATRAGLLDLHWDVLCPNCRVAKATVTNLADLALEAHCDTCHIRYDVNFDEYVELRFTVSGAVRSVNDATFCIAGPFQSRHILAQFYLRPGEQRVIAADFAPGRYRWRTRQRSERGEIHIDPAGAPGPLVYRFTPDDVEAWSEIPDPQAQISDLPGDRASTSDGASSTPHAAPHKGSPAGFRTPHALLPGAPLHFENTSARELLLIFETTDWGNESVSAALVTSLQEFRSMFSSQVLAPGLGVAIRNLTLLFSDLKDSTALYERVGDSPAYVRVRDHVALLREIIGAHNGALVKTIGDAVMAVFAVPADAVRAALAIQAAFARANATVPPEERLSIKLGAHCGPCIAIAANDVLDYFGSTVNTAARAQGAGHGDDLVLTARVYNDPGVQDALAGLPVEPFTADLKGLASLFTLYRVLPAGALARWPPALPAAPDGAR